MPDTSIHRVDLRFLWRRRFRAPSGWVAFCLIAKLLLLGTPEYVFARGVDISVLCDRAARAAAGARDVPYDVLLAISRAETGRSVGKSLQPWPWTVNMEGQGKWFDTEDEARAYVFRHFKSGARSFDVGCFQINYKWHGAAFRSIDDMFDPMQNAHYAAGFLRELYQELGDWSAAAGAYHSRTPTYAKRYSTRFNTIRDSITSDPEIAILTPVDETAGRFDSAPGLFSRRRKSSLTGQGSVRLGSLVPVLRDPAPSNHAFVVLNRN